MVVFWIASTALCLLCLSASLCFIFIITCKLRVSGSPVKAEISVKNVTILGSTGTIGQQTLDVIAQHPQRFNAFALAANSNVDGLFKQCLQYLPEYAVLLDTSAATRLQSLLKE